MSNDTVWQFWEGPVPAYIDLCFETVRAHAPLVRRLDLAAFEELRTEPEIDLTGLMVQHQADYIRAYLLNTYGGMWLDADCVVLSDLQPFLDALRVSDYIGYRDNFDGIQIGLMVARARGNVISRHYAKVVDFLASGQELQWLSIGQWRLDNALVEVSWQGYLQLDRRTVAPIGWEQTEAFFVERTDEEHAQHFVDDAHCYMLSNSTVPGWFRDLSRDEVLSGPTFLSYLLRRALS